MESERDRKQDNNTKHTAAFFIQVLFFQILPRDTKNPKCVVYYI